MRGVVGTPRVSGTGSTSMTDADASAGGPLDGVVVADFSRVLAGPLATMMLGDLGAEVVKIERPGLGDDTRSWGPPFDEDGTATYYLSVNRNKRSVTLDLTDTEQRSQARALAVSADVVVENFRAGTMERFELDYDSLRADNPGLVYCRVSAFGPSGGRDLPGYDFIVQAAGGDRRQPHHLLENPHIASSRTPCAGC